LKEFAMRYLILKPTKPTDPRELELASLADLHAVMVPVIDCENESQAVRQVRKMFPNAVGMPVPISIGSGKSFLLGFVEEANQVIDPDGAIPFAVCVQAIAQNDADRHAMKKGPAFDRALWKIKPIIPDLGTSHRVELRATDLEVPAYVDAKVGHHNGKLTIYVELGGVEMSLSFVDATSIG
jgi:hypothetical protein